MASTETAVLFEEIARLNQENKELLQRNMALRLDVSDWRMGRRIVCALCLGTGTNTYAFPMCACEKCNGDGSVLTEAAKREDAALVELEGG
jgi:DnaJ-class molecular chaperone